MGAKGTRKPPPVTVGAKITTVTAATQKTVFRANQTINRQFVALSSILFNNVIKTHPSSIHKPGSSDPGFCLIYFKKVTARVSPVNVDGGGMTTFPRVVLFYSDDGKHNYRI